MHDFKSPASAISLYIYTANKPNKFVDFRSFFQAFLFFIKNATFQSDFSFKYTTIINSSEKLGL